MTSIQRILKLLGEKYPTDYTKGMNPILVIYDDESGGILRDAQKSIYGSNNRFFEFSDIEHLVKHLEEK